MSPKVIGRTIKAGTAKAIGSEGRPNSWNDVLAWMENDDITAFVKAESERRKSNASLHGAVVQSRHPRRSGALPRCGFERRGVALLFRPEPGGGAGIAAGSIPRSLLTM